MMNPSNNLLSKFISRQEPRPFSREEWLTATGFFVLGLVIRWIYVSQKYWFSGDSGDYVRIARNMVFSHAFALDGVDGSIYLTAFRPPLYPIIIAALWWSAEPPLNAVLALQIILGAFTAGMIYLMARQHFSRAVAIIAALMMTFAPMTLHYTAVIATETLFTFLVTGGFFLWGREKFVSAGILFGLATLTRPIMLPFIALLIILTWLKPWRLLRRSYFIMAVVIGLVILPWCVRNTLVFQQPILIQSSGYGTNLLCGTIEIEIFGDEAWSKVIKDPDFEFEFRDPNETAQDKRRMNAALGRITGNPLYWLRVRAKQYPRLFLDSGDYLLGKYNVGFSAALASGQWSIVLFKLLFHLLNISFFILAFFGMWIERKRFAELSHIILFPIFIFLIHLPMWIEARYALPVIPLLAILAATGLVRIWESLKIKFLIA